MIQELKVGEPCPTCERKYLGKMGPGDYSCVVCGMGMLEPCEHWKNMQAAPEPQPQASEVAPGGDKFGECGELPSTEQNSVGTELTEQPGSSGINTHPLRNEHSPIQTTEPQGAEAPDSPTVLRLYEESLKREQIANLELREQLEQSNAESEQICKKMGLLNLIDALNWVENSVTWQQELESKLEQAEAKLSAAPRPQEPRCSIKADSLFGVYCGGNPESVPANDLIYWDGWQRLADYLNAQFFSPAQSPQPLVTLSQGNQSGAHSLATPTIYRRCDSKGHEGDLRAEPHMTEVSKGIFTSKFCSCPNQDDTDGAYCPLCGKLKGPAQSQGAAPEGEK